MALILDPIFFPALATSSKQKIVSPVRRTNFSPRAATHKPVENRVPLGCGGSGKGCTLHYHYHYYCKIIDSVHAHDPSGMCVYLISLLGKRVLVNKTKMGCSKEEAATITLHYCTTPSLHRYTTSIPYNHTGNSQGAINSTLP